MIIWINGAFGVGKTTAARALVNECSTLRLFDPEDVGEMLVRNLSDQQVGDFQDLAAWRDLVPQVASHIQRQTAQDLVAVQSVLNESYWVELTRAFVSLNETLFHVVLDADAHTLAQRITNDIDEVEARQWRRENLTHYRDARDWMLDQADLVVDTSALQPSAVAERIHAAAHTQRR